MLTLDKIEIRGALVPKEIPIVAKVGQFSEWPFVIVDVYTKEGVIGTSYLEPYVKDSIHAIAGLTKIVESQFKGKKISPYNFYETAMKTFHLNGREGLTIITLAGLDMAIWDALGKALNAPLVTLLGGEPGPIRAYNTNGLWLIPLDKIEEQATHLVNQGDFKAIKIRLGREKLEDDIKAISLVRKSVGEDIILMSDFNQGYTLGEAQIRMKDLDDQNLYWFEEPIVYDDYAGYSQLKERIKTPITFGENIYGSRSFLKAIQERCSDLIMPDLMRIGGVTGWMRSAAIAGAANIPLSSHLYPDISAQLLRVSESADWLEWSDWISPILENPIKVKNGFAETSDLPGLGLKWNEAKIKELQYF